MNETFYMQTEKDWTELFMCDFRWLTTTFSRTLEIKLRLETGQKCVMLSFLRVDFFIREETRADLKCEGREPSVSDELTIDNIC